VYCALLHNITFGDTPQQSPWFRKFAEEFQGKLFPFGCGVWFLPAPAKSVPDKAAPNMSYGIFLGYRMAPGCRWGGQYVICNLSDFANKRLNVHAPGQEHRVWPHFTEQVFLPKKFPVKTEI